MDEIREVAKAYYDGAPMEEKKMAQNFFKTLDQNGDGKVRLADFKNKVGLGPSFSNEEMFKQLDENGDGTLDFNEVLALCYMNNVSIPRCSACKHMLLTSYFCCLPCEGKTSYRLCCNCYAQRKFDHQHPSHQFVDSRALLKLLEELVARTRLAPTRRNHILDQESVAQRTEATMGNIEEIVETGIDLKDAMDTGEGGIDLADAMDAVEGGIDVIDVVVELGTTAITSGCSIM